MAPESETPAAAAPEAMELSTPVKEEQVETADIQTPTPTPTPRKRGRPAKGKASVAKVPKTPTKGKGKNTGTDTGTGNGANTDNAEAEAEADTATATATAGNASAGEEEEAASETEASPSKKGKTSTSAGASVSVPTTSSGGSSKKVMMGPIPTSFEAAGLPDQLILRMRDDEGCNWPEINTAWTAMTGISVGKTTLRMRYRTMKSNFVCVVQEDEPRLIQAKHDVEERFEVEKWAKIADLVESSGGRKYPAISLQKKWKAMASQPGGIISGSGPAASTAASASTSAAGTGSAATAAGHANADDIKEEEA